MADVTILPYGARSAVSRWFDDYFTERDRQMLPWLATMVILTFIVAGPGLLLWLASLLPINELGNSGASVRAHLIVQAIAATLAVAVVVPLVVRLSRPSFIEFSRKGIQRVWLVAGLIPLKGALQQWETVKAVKLLKPAGTADPERFLISFAKSDSDPGICLSIGELEKETTKSALMDCVSRYCDHVDPDIINTLTPRGSLSFTELWLEALSAPPGRERLLPLEAGTLLDHRYKTIKRLGAGGQGTVYLAEDTQASAPANQVVLKETILPVYADLTARKRALEEFHKEAFALESASHPNIVKFLRSFVADHRAYLVLEYVNGSTLSEVIARQGSLTCAQAREFGLKMCDILQALHGLETPLIHRDFTPDNLMLAGNGELVLIDFAVSVAGEASGADVAGKASYMAPEQLKGKPTPQSDVYAMGCTIYYLLTGFHPEPLGEAHPILVNDEVSKEMNDFVARCTSQDQATRYESALTAKEALERVLG